jgi:hypothetical protein
MSYSVQFIGLACFLRSGNERQVLFPDGRSPAGGIEPHYASIVVGPDSIKETSGWNGDTALSSGTFELPPCDLTIEEADTPGFLDTSRHDGKLPQLSRIDPNFRIDPARAETIATLRVRQGTLTAYLIPGGTAVISQLDVPHDGDIHITVTPRDGSLPRSIVLKAETEIALTNTGRGGYATLNETGDHFQIYEKLSSGPVRLNEPEDATGVPRSPSQHVFFARATPIGLSSGCSNTGCCE